MPPSASSPNSSQTATSRVNAMDGATATSSTPSCRFGIPWNATTKLASFSERLNPTRLFSGQRRNHHFQEAQFADILTACVIVPIHLDWGYEPTLSHLTFRIVPMGDITKE